MFRPDPLHLLGLPHPALGLGRGASGGLPIFIHTQMVFAINSRVDESPNRFDLLLHGFGMLLSLMFLVTLGLDGTLWYPISKT